MTPALAGLAMMLRWISPPTLLLLFACGSAEIEPQPPPVGQTTGSIIGTVSTLGLEDRLHVVAGAHVRAAGVEAVTDSYGRFLLEGIPTEAPISIMVRGPDGEREQYAENRIIVTIPSSSGVITPDLQLLRTCSFAIDGVSGGTGGCAGDDRASLEFPAGSIASSNVEAKIAVLDPEQIGDRLAFPQGRDDEMISILGGISVELFDVADGRKLQIDAGSAVRVRFELAASDATAGDIQLQWFDEGSGDWLEQPSGRVVAVGARSFYEFDATHFSTYRGVRFLRSGPNTCLTFSPRVCAQTGCEERAVWISTVDIGTLSVTRGTYGPRDVCVPAFVNHSYLLFATYLDPNLGLAPNAPLYTTVRRASTPMSTPPLQYECTADCFAIGNVDLAPRTPGCVTGTLMTSCGLGCTEPYAGPLDVLHRGLRVASVEIAAECGGNTCIPTPIEWSGEPVELRTATGHRLSFDPMQTSRGEVCGTTACASSPKCQDLGTAVLSCGQAVGECLEAEFTALVRENDAACSAEAPHLLLLDASATIGNATGYRWTVHLLDDQGATTKVDARTESWGRTQFCLPGGLYRVSLTAISDSTFSLPFLSTIAHEVAVGADSIELSIVATPGTRVAPGTPVTLTVITPDDPSQYELFWWTGRADDPSRIHEGPSVTVTPMGTQQMFGVFASKNGVRVGRATIVIEVDTSASMYVEIETTDPTPLPDQAVTFSPMTIDSSGRDVVSCVQENITAVRWVLTEISTGAQEMVDHVAAPGMSLACDRSINGPLYERRFPEGRFNLHVTVEAADGSSGTAWIEFEVGF